MPGFLPGIHVLVAEQSARRGWPGQARPWRCGQSALTVIAGHSRLKDGVLSPAYAPAIHKATQRTQT